MTLAVGLGLLSSLSATSSSNQADTDTAQYFGKPILHRKIPVPAALLSTDNDPVYGGDIRIGDLTGNGQADFLVYRAALSVDGGAVHPCFLGAFDESGKVLWQHGQGGKQPNRPGPVAIHDIDGDGKAEVITFRGKLFFRLSSWPATVQC